MSHAHIVWYNTTGELKNADGSVVPPDQMILTHPTYDAKDAPPEAELLQKVLDGLPAGAHIELVQDEDYPDRSKHDFVDAWECDHGTITCNLAKARGIHMNKIRTVRNKQLADLDVPFMRAMETGDASELARIASKKQVLRDIPQTLDLTTDTQEELKAVWPIELLELE